MEIKPFKAFRFDGAVVSDVGSCIAPPYDVINPAHQKRLYEKSEYNIVRITKGIADPADNEISNRYTRAAELFRKWISQGVLKQDSRDAIYAYVQDFQIGGADFQRFSFISLGKLEEFGAAVRPHEQILSGPLADRLNLLRAAQAHFGLVFMLYEDPKNVADKAIQKAACGASLIDFLDDDNVRHRIFAITEKTGVTAIAKMMEKKNCVIADGHHRYTTGLIYAKENPAAKYQMLAFCNTRHDGLVVLATHRIVGGINNFKPENLLGGLKANFTLTEYPFENELSKKTARIKMLDQMKAEHRKDKIAFGIYIGGGAFYVAVPRDLIAMDSVAGNMSKPWRSLDVAVVHKLIIEKLLGIGDEQLAGGQNVEYVKDNNNAIKDIIAKIDSGCKQAAFFLNPPRIKQIQEVAEHGERMPQKSTYFYPKVFTGLTIQKL
ncbi:MAG: DUF1015 domain-containing protein [Sedimentisphaerales bacterium]|nr:DUF1015 domain-containing protein [Sedimentisphaerales bacterium]